MSQEQAPDYHEHQSEISALYHTMLNPTVMSPWSHNYSMVGGECQVIVERVINQWL
jgi:hypothetical protein